MRNVLQQLVENAEAVEEEEIREDASRLYRAMGAESPDAAFLALATRPMPYLYFGRLQVEALTLLATLLGGPRAAEVRNRLLDAGAQVVLAHAMRTVEWGSSREPLPPEVRCLLPPRRTHAHTHAARVSDGQRSPSHTLLPSLCRCVAPAPAARPRLRVQRGLQPEDDAHPRGPALSAPHARRRA